MHFWNLFQKNIVFLLIIDKTFYIIKRKERVKDMDSVAVKENYRIGVLEKSLGVIEALVKHPGGVALRELAKETGLNKSTLFRILYTLQINGYVSQGENGIYRLNYKFSSLFSQFPDADLQVIANRYLPELASNSGKIPYFYVQDGDFSVCIAKYDAIHSKRIKISVNVGERTYLHCTSGGKIFLAAMSDEEIDQWFSRTTLVRRATNTITDPAKMKEEIARVRKYGYSINNIENEESIISVAAPICNKEGKVVAAINVGDTILDFKLDSIPEVAEIVMQTAAKISKELGYDYKDGPFPHCYRA